MSAKLKVKIAILIVVALCSMGAMGVLLSTMQNSLSMESYTQEMRQEIDALPELLSDANSNVEQNTTTYNEIYQSKAESIAFIANNNAGFEVTDAKMAEYKELLGTDNVMVVNREGVVLAKAQDTLATFSSSRFNELRTVFVDGEPSQPVEVDLPDQDWLMRYYAARIDDNTMVVIEQNPDELRQLVEETGSAESTLSNIGIGQHGYVFAISAQDYLIEYHPNSNLVGSDAVDAGIDVVDLEDGCFTWMKLNGESLYCGVSRIHDTYYVAAVPESDIAASRDITVGAILFVFFAVMCVVIAYGIFVMNEDERRGTDAQDYRSFGPFRYNKTIIRKAAVLSFVGLLGIVLMTFYMQTLFALSAQSVTNNERAAEVVESMHRANGQTADLKEQYNERYLGKCKVAGYILSQNSSLANRADLKELADVLQIQIVNVFNETGDLTASNMAFVAFNLSDDPQDQSYEFRKILDGAASVVQDAQLSEGSSEFRQYIGVPLTNSEGDLTGLVQIGIRPMRLENMISSLQIDSVLDGVKTGADGFAFAVSKEDGTFTYYPDERLMGKSATEFGLTENQIKDGFCDYVTINGTRYYASAAESDYNYIFIASTEGELMSERAQLTLVSGAVALACLVVIFLLLVFEPRRSFSSAKPAIPEDDSRMFDVTMPSGRTAKTESAASRWLDRSFKWSEKTAEQKTSTVVKWFVGVSVLVVCVAVVFQDQFFGSGSIFSYILGGEWEHGINVFAITACIMFVCVVATVVTLLQMLLDLVSSVLGARGETMCRLLADFIKYASIIGMVYYCLVLVGVDTMTLLASAGILSIAISFGAKELVSDILSGLFIIFEGEFRVGDTIKVGDWRGTVVEIGVRTTKVEDSSKNVKVIRNSDISNVINMTKEVAYANCDVGIEYGESLERVENILEKELPNIRKHLPYVTDGPFYKGVVELGDSSVIIRIVARCAEADRAVVLRSMNRQMKLLFDQYNISIPYPHMVVSQPSLRQKATEIERESADRFHDEQKEVTRDIGDEGDEGKK